MNRWGHDMNELKKLETMIDRVMENVDGDSMRARRFHDEIPNLSEIKAGLWAHVECSYSSIEMSTALILYALAPSHAKRARTLARLIDNAMHEDFLEKFEAFLKTKSWYDADEFLECVGEVFDYGGDPSSDWKTSAA